MCNSWHAKPNREKMKTLCSSQDYRLANVPLTLDDRGSTIVGLKTFINREALAYLLSAAFINHFIDIFYEASNRRSGSLLPNFSRTKHVQSLRKGLSLRAAFGDRDTRPMAHNP